MKIGIIGSGNMASAMLGGFLSSGAAKADEVCISDVNADKLSGWKEKGVKTLSDNKECAGNAEIVIFAVKPNILPLVLKELGAAKADKIYVSIAAGFPIERIEKYLGKNAKIIRAMPNTPAQVGCGMTVFSANENVSDEEKKTVQKLLGSFGEALLVNENKINAATAIHSSSPAYIYMLIDAMADMGVKYGFTKKDSLLLAAKAVEGTAKMVLNSGEHIMQLKDNVCSPGGTTIEAVLELERNGFKSDIQAAIEKCIEKAENM